MLGVLAIPIVAVLLLIGLPVMVLGVVAATLLSIVFGVLAATTAVGFVVLKLLLFIVLPVCLLGWIVSAMFGRRNRETR